jgi:hypothetical protein
MHGTGPRCLPLPTPMAFDALGPLILGDPALHLQEEGVFWALAPGTVQAHDVAPGTSAGIDEHHWVGVCAGQTSRRVEIPPGHTARCDPIAEALQRRAAQRGSASPVVKTRHGLGHHRAIGRAALAQGGSRARDRLRRGLLVG